MEKNNKMDNTINETVSFPSSPKLTDVPNCTLITAIYDLTKYHPQSRSIEQSIKDIESLLSVPCYLVIYGDNNTIPIVKRMRDKNKLSSLTIYKEIPLEKIWSYQYLSQVKENREKYWPTRDERTCSESHILVCNKFDFVEQIINDNPFHTQRFGWIDANLRKMCQDYTVDKLLSILNYPSDQFQIQILNVVDKKYKLSKNKKEYYQSYPWLVCGCLFILPSNKIKILSRLKEIFIETTKLGYGHAEEALYLEVLDEFYQDIKRSYGDYNQIINNFLQLTYNFDYVYHVIFLKYYDKKYHRECYDCGQFLLTYNKIPIDQLFDIIFKLYISSYYYNKELSKPILNKFFQLCQEKDEFKQLYLQNKDFYDQQIKFVLE